MVINAFLLSLLPLVAGSAIPSRYRQLSPRAGRNTQEEVEYVIQLQVLVERDVDVDDVSCHSSCPLFPYYRLVFAMILQGAG